MTPSARELRDALREHKGLFEVYVTTDKWTDGTVWVGLALTEGEADLLTALLSKDDEE